jgi:light-regulated signal transduction histidine kinase (bacteriophytochrome)
MNASLGQKNRELELLNEELESFNYVASHDLQEPLRKIQIYSNRLLEGKDELSEQAQESLTKVLSAAERMQNLITDLIEFSQVSSSAESFEEVDLNQVLSEVSNTLSEMILESGTELVVEPLPVVRAIPFHMIQLFTNLVNNAIKYRKPGETPRVKVSSGRVDGSELGQPSNRRYLAVSVQDNGIGFDPAQRDNIFELFKRLHTREKYAGTGIGLAICKKIMQHHDGFIRASGEPGQGATFTIYLPQK